MNNKQIINTHPLISGTCISIIVFILIVSMHWLSEILNPFFISVLLAVIIMPIVKMFLNRGLSPNISLWITILFVTLLVLALTIILGFAAADVSQKIPEYNERIVEFYNSGLKYLESRGFDKTELQELKIFNPDKLFSFSISFLNGLFSSFSNFLLVILLTIFLLIEFVKIDIKIQSKDKKEDSFYSRLDQLYIDLKKYLSITAFTGLIAAVADVILLLILGIDFAILIGFLSFLFNFIPNLGFIMTIIPPFLLALLKFGLLKAIIVVIGFTVINTIVDNVIKPKFIGKEFDMTILLVFLSLLFWGLVLGPIGAILAVPLTLTSKRLINFLREYNNFNSTPLLTENEGSELTENEDSEE